MLRWAALLGHPFWCISFTTIAMQFSSGTAHTPYRLFMLMMLLALTRTCFDHGQVLHTNWLNWYGHFIGFSNAKQKIHLLGWKRGKKWSGKNAIGIFFPREPTTMTPSEFAGRWRWEWQHKNKGNIPPPPHVCTLLAHTQLANTQVLLIRAAAQSASLFSCYRLWQ